jgi:hypothetical protein
MWTLAPGILIVAGFLDGPAQAALSGSSPWPSITWAF